MFGESPKVPTLIPLPEDFSAISCSNNMTYCISKETQQVYKFGFENKKIKKPKIVVFPEPKVKIQSISCGKDFTLFLSNFQILYGYGDNTFGQLGQGDIKPRKNPCLISFPGKDSAEYVQNVQCGYKHVICRTTNMKIYTWVIYYLYINRVQVDPGSQDKATVKIFKYLQYLNVMLQPNNPLFR